MHDKGGVSMNFDGDKTVAHSNGSKILLTVEDRKIDESFECVKKVWIGEDLKR